MLLETRDLEVARDIMKANSAVNDLHLSVFKAIARERLAGIPRHHGRRRPGQPLLRALRRPRRLRRPEGHLPGHRRLAAEQHRAQLTPAPAAPAQTYDGGRSPDEVAGRRRCLSLGGRYFLPWLATAWIASAAASGSR